LPEYSKTQKRTPEGTHKVFTIHKYSATPPKYRKGEAQKTI